MQGKTSQNHHKNGENTNIYFSIASCSLNYVLVAANSRGICAIFLGDDPDTLANDLHQCFNKAQFVNAPADFERTVSKVVTFIDHSQNKLDLPLDIQGTAFQQRVWQALSQIPTGTTASYTDIANHIGMPKAVRAVAGACAANTLAIAIPCHRVLRNDGQISGYRWGVERKKQILEKEALTVKK